MQNLEMEVYNIEQKFPGEVLKSTSISFEDGIIQLIVRLDGLSEMEVESFRNKPVDINLCYVEDEIIFTFKIEGLLEWSDIAYTPHLTKDLRVIEFDNNEGYILNMFLVDTETNILKGMRILGPGTDFSNKFNELIKKVKGKDFNNEKYLKKMYSVQNRLSSRDINKFKISGFEFN